MPIAPLSTLPRYLLRLTTLLVALTAVWIYLNYQTLEDYFAARERHSRYQTEVERRRAERDRLLAEYEALSADGFDKEKAIRERLHMVHPDEEILYIVGPEDGSSSAGAQLLSPVLPPIDESE